MIPVTVKGENPFKEYRQVFTYSKGTAILRICSDFRFAAYINGAFANNSQYADIPEKKAYNTVDITRFLKKGENELTVIAMSTDADYSVARKMSPFVAFEIEADGKIVKGSGTETLGRESSRYSLGDRITPQIGRGYNYDFAAAENEWKPVTLSGEKFNFVNRPVKNLVVSDKPAKSEICAQGVFKYSGGETSAEKMQNAYLSFKRFSDMTGKDRLSGSSLPGNVAFSFKDEKADGIFVVVDLKRETAGYLDFEITVPKSCKAALGWGEHLSDLRVRTAVGGRNFAVGINLKAGENKLDEYILRLGCRYLCLFIESDSCEINGLSLFEASYPFAKQNKDFGDRLLNKIYETGRRSLELCAHEHYEDCPWREQALYGMDSRNQMLFGYGAFGETDFPRASIELFADTLTPSGLISLCAPANITFTIPSFSAYWIIALCENADRDYKEEFVKRILPAAERVLGVFEQHTSDKGVMSFSECGFWNFHEWVEGLDGGDFNRKDKEEEKADGILTAVTAIAAKKLSALYSRAGETEKARKTREFAEFLEKSLENFYDGEKGLYASYIMSDGGKKGYHGYMQSVIAAEFDIPKDRRASLVFALKNPTGRIVPQTFASLQFKYEAIIRVDGNTDWVIDDVCENFGKMIFEGATSYYETENGEADFNDVGSLCHGWAAIPCYIFDKYLINKVK
ncbi:MAG: hypothetical protein PUJ49_04370 [bacterium]|nr:hypothetical protein [bacterium]